MSYIDTQKDDFYQMYVNGYTSKEITLLDTSNVKKLIGNGNIPQMGILPSCHLNFGNLGKIKFSFDLPEADSMNMNMFKKLNRLSTIVREINGRCITLIEELKCCKLAEVYNSSIIPIFEWVLKDFINTLVSIAESILKSYQVLKVMVCIIRPVPGNPWLRGAGFDFLKYLYSFVDAFEAVYTWIIDGNPIDIILNPVEAFNKKISSCAPDKYKYNRLNDQDLEISKKRLESIINEYSNGTNQINNRETIDKYNDLNIKQEEYFNQLEDLNRLIVSNNNQSSNLWNITDAERYDLLNEEIEINDQVNEIILKLADIESQMASININKENAQLTNDTLMNDFLARKTLDKLIIDSFNPTCSCLLELAGTGNYKPPTFVTINTYESFDYLLSGKVLFADKDVWLDDLQKIKENQNFDEGFETLYLSRDNFSTKFSETHTIERNILTSYISELYTANITFETNYQSFNKSSKLLYRYINAKNDEITETFIPGSTETTSEDPFLIYSDSGHSGGKVPHNAKNIDTMFKLNQLRLDEKYQITKDLYKFQGKQRNLEYDLLVMWNVLRRNAIQKVRYAKFTEQMLDDALDSAQKTLIEKADEALTVVSNTAKSVYAEAVTFAEDVYNLAMYQLGQDYPVSASYDVNSPEYITMLNRQAAIEKELQLQKESQLSLYDQIVSDGKDVYDKVMASTSNYYNDIKEPTVDVIEAQIILNALGTSFDIHKFIEFLNSDTISGRSLNSQKFVSAGGYASRIIYDETVIPNQFIGETTSTIDDWVLCNIEIAKREVMIDRLNQLIEIDNVIVWIVDDGLVICGCDILCVILQKILDIILSAVNALIQTIIKKLMMMVMGKELTYIIKVIMEKFKCFLMGLQISENIKKISKVADSIRKNNERELDQASDPIGCNVDNQSKLSKLLKNDEVIISPEPDYKNIDNNGKIILTQEDTMIFPMPSYGTDNALDAEEPQNSYINHGAILGNSTTGRNIPELLISCTDNQFPSVEVKIEPRPKFEILIAFIPSDFILNAEVLSTPQTISNPLDNVTDPLGNNININDIANPIVDLADIMKRVTQQVQDAIAAPIFLETSCDTKINNINNSTTLCSRDNLIISSLSIIENDVVVTDGHLGTLSAMKYFNSNLDAFEYFPEHKDADANGMVKILSNNPFWTYTTPATITTVIPNSVVITSKVVPTGPVYNNSITTNTIDDIQNFEKIKTETTRDIKYSVLTNITTETTITTTKITIVSAFRKPNLEILIDFKNSVNNFKVRGLLDVVAYDLLDVPIEYNRFSYNGRYLEYVEIGHMAAGSNNTFNISFERLLFLSNNILKSNYLITNPSAVADKAGTASDVPIEPNKCLLPSEQKTALVNNQALVDNLLLTINNGTLSIEDAITKIGETPVPVEPIIEISPLLTGIPFLVLNKELNIMVQIVNRKMYLQFPSNSFHISEPVIIDHVLIPGNTYMFIFNTNGLTFKLSLITEDKEIFTATGMNTDFLSLQPSIIGGNTTRTSSMCGGKILDIIISKNGNNTIDYYNRSIMSYIPRLAQIVFDFSLTQGSRVFNTITSVGNDYYVSNYKKILSNEYGSGSATELAKQRADMHGEVKTNKFYQVLEGYMENFFCKDNLGDKSFSISFWIYNKKCLKNNHSIISDDINKNYIYYDAMNGRLVINFKNQISPIIRYVVLSTWTQIVFSYDKYLKTFYLTIHDIKGNRQDIEFVDSSKFFLMSLLAEYDYQSKMYVNQFIGYLSTVSIFMYKIDARTQEELFKNQKLLVQGMENDSI